MIFQNKIFGVFGLGKSGKSAVEFLMRKDAVVYAWDDNSKNMEQALCICENPEEWNWSELEALILSPGIPLTNPKPHRVVELAKNANVKIICDIELLYNKAPNATYIGITGTNGKSTTTSLIYHIAKHAGFDIHIGGNIGTAASSLPILDECGIYILELSSYQLDLLDKTSFNISVLLNITPDHIDRHGDMLGYVNSKKRIFRGQCRGDTTIISIDDNITLGIYDEMKNNSCTDVVAVSYTDELNVVNVNLRGKHNRQNISAAYAVMKTLGADDKTILDGINSFGGLAHRLQYVDEKRGITFINDSKATNATATANALASFDDVFWIAGGIEKEGGIISLEKFFSHIKHTFLIGDAQDSFAETLEGKTPYTKCGTLKNAFDKAVELASKKDSEGVILFSPACASFDQFKNFEERGDKFCKLVGGVDKL